MEGSFWLLRTAIPLKRRPRWLHLAKRLGRKAGCTFRRRGQKRTGANRRLTHTEGTSRAFCGICRGRWTSPRRCLLGGHHVQGARSWPASRAVRSFSRDGTAPGTSCEARPQSQAPRESSAATTVGDADCDALADLTIIRVSVRGELRRRKAHTGNLPSVQDRREFVGANPRRSNHLKRRVRAASHRDSARLQNLDSGIQECGIDCPQIR